MRDWKRDLHPANSTSHEENGGRLQHLTLLDGARRFLAAALAPHLNDYVKGSTTCFNMVLEGYLAYQFTTCSKKFIAET